MSTRNKNLYMMEQKDVVYRPDAIIVIQPAVLKHC